jgi:CheY-like chemotaxis protein
MALHGGTAKVLLAQAAGINSAIRESLGACEVRSVQTFDEAKRALERETFDLVLIDLQFDQSRMLELLEYLKCLDGYQDVPVVCLQGTDRRVSDALRTNMNHAVRALGGRAFFDLRAADEMTAQTCDYLRQILALSTLNRP